MALALLVAGLSGGCAPPDDTTDELRNPLVGDPEDGGYCIQVIAFAVDPATGACEEFPTPCDVPEGWEPCPAPIPEDEELPCIQVVAFAIDPATGICTPFPTPCDVPEGWEPCHPAPCDDGSELVCDAVRPLCGATQVAAVQDGCWVCVDAETCEPQICMQVIANARDPATGVCTMFPTPCDVPAGWEWCPAEEAEY